ncbi:MAG: TonB-dependent receptor [Gammaproteobacteria bacterium HGW-Gammaproteobacteria-12]|nr:MAG: TonB-dependent receptor [Gammaproteobacteria bacterium HGW-Gammaproteobacteria-12]
MPSYRSVHAPLRTAIRHALLCSSLALGGVLPVLSLADASAPHAYQIAGGPLAEVLNRYASAAGVALSFDSAALQGQSSPGLQGPYAVEDGFARLLQGSGLRAVRQGEGVYGLERQPQPRSGNGDVLQLDSVTVSTLRSDTAVGQTSQRVTVIDRQQIEQQLALSSDPGQVLSNLIPSYSPSRQKMSNAGETLRGRTPQFLVDGVPQASSIRNDGRSSYTIDLAQIERIEVIHGASAEHGGGATGGIVNFISRRPEGNGITQHAGVSLESDDRFSRDGLGYKMNYRVSALHGDWETLFGATWQERGAFYDANNDLVGIAYPGEIQDTRDHDLMFKLGYWLDDVQHLQFSANHYELKGNNDYVPVLGDRAAGIPSTARKGDPQGDPAFNKNRQYSFSYSNQDLYGNVLDVQLYHQRYRGQFGALLSASFQDPNIAPVGTLWEQSRSDSEKWGGKLTLRRSGLFDGLLDLTGGLDLMRDKGEQVLVQSNRSYVPPSTYDNQAGFLQGDLHLTDKLTLMAGVRREHSELDVDDFRTVWGTNNAGGVSVTGGQVSFGKTLSNYGFTYQATDWAQLYGGYSEGFGMPDIGRVLRGLDEPGLEVENLLELEPIVTRSREVGLRLSFERVDMELSYYESFSNLGERLSVNDDGNYIANRERVEIQGYELTGNWHIDDRHSLRGSYAHSQGKSDTDDDGKVDTRLTGLNIAPDQYSLGWQANWNDDWSSYLQYNYYVSRSFDDPRLEFDGYALLSASVSRRLPLGSLSLGIDNLLDEDYFTYYSQSARIADDYNFKGRGRTFTLGYQVEF